MPTVVRDAVETRTDSSVTQGGSDVSVSPVSSQDNTPRDITPDQTVGTIDPNLVDGRSGGWRGPTGPDASQSQIAASETSRPSADRAVAEQQSQTVTPEQARQYLASPELGWKTKSADVSISEMISANSPDAAYTYEAGQPVERVAARYIRIGTEHARRQGIPQNFENEGEIYIAVSQAEVDWAAAFEQIVQARVDALVASGLDEVTARNQAFHDTVASYNDPSIEARARSAIARVHLARDLDTAAEGQENVVTASLTTYSESMRGVECPVYGANANWKAIWEGMESAQAGARGQDVRARGPSVSADVSQVESGSPAQPSGAREEGRQAGGVQGSAPSAATEGGPAVGSPSAAVEATPASVQPAVQEAAPAAAAAIQRAPEIQYPQDPRAEYREMDFVDGAVHVSGITSPGNPDTTRNKYGGVNYDGQMMFEFTLNGEKVSLAAALDGMSMKRDGVDYAIANFQRIIEESKVYLSSSGNSVDERSLLIEAISRLDDEVGNRGLRGFTGAFILAGKGWVLPAKFGDAEIYEMGSNGMYHWLPESSHAIDHPTWDQLSLKDRAELMADGVPDGGPVPLNIVNNGIGGGLRNNYENIRRHIFSKRQVGPGSKYAAATDGCGLPYDERNQPVSALVEQIHNPTPQRVVGAAIQGNDNVTFVVVEMRQ